mgnify:CR=1 FL=1
MYKTCAGSCGANEAFNMTVEVTPAGGAVATLFINDGPLSVGYDGHNGSPDPDFTGTFHSAAFYDCPPPPCDINEHVASNVCTACVGGSTIRAGRTLLAAARQIRPSFRTYAPRAATGVPPMQSMRFQVQTPRVFILPVSKLSEYTSWRTTWRTTRTGRGTTDLKRYRSPRRAWKTAVFALATRLASRQPW